MSNKILLIFFLIAQSFFAQNAGLRFYWYVNEDFSDSSNNFSEKFAELQNSGYDLITVSGKITHSRFAFPLLKKIVDDAEIPVKILPSPESLVKIPEYLAYVENFDGRTFLFKKNNFVLVGLNSANNYEPSKGFFSPEDLLWLEEELEQLPDSLRYFLFTELPPDRIVNFNALERLLAGNFFETVFLPEKPEKISKKYYFVYPPVSATSAEISINANNLTAVFNEVRFNQTFKRHVLDKNEKEPSFFDFNEKVLTKIWEQQLNATFYSGGTVCKKRIYVTQNDGLLTCLDSDGSVIWDFDLFGDVFSPPVIKDGFLIASTLQGDLILINALNGDALQTIGFDAPITSELRVFDYNWKVNTMSPKKSGSKAAVVFGDANGILRCYDVETLEKIWETDVCGNSLDNPPYVTNNQILFVNGKSVYSLSKKNGALLWRKDFDEKLDGEITLGKNDMFLFSERKIYSIDIQLGKINWTSEKYSPKKLMLGKSRKTLFIINANGNLYMINSYNGKFKKKIPLKLSGGNFMFANSNGRLLIASSGKIVALSRNGKARTIFKDEFPISTMKVYDKNKILIGDVCGHFFLTKYTDK